jgi:hypothetical protein
MTRGRPLKEVIRIWEESSTRWKGRSPCAIVNLHLLGEAKVDGLNLFSLRVHAILGGVPIFYKQF